VNPVSVHVVACERVNWFLKVWTLQTISDLLKTSGHVLKAFRPALPKGEQFALLAKFTSCKHTISPVCVRMSTQMRHLHHAPSARSMS